MLEKVRPTTHRESGQDSEPETGLSEGRLALVHRYMVDAEEADLAASAPGKSNTERAPAETRTAAAQEQARRDAAARTQRRRERERRRTPDISLTGEFEQASTGNEPRKPREETRGPKALVKADKRAAKEAARQIAALEKKEARERKALAKAAARRKAV